MEDRPIGGSQPSVEGGFDSELISTNAKAVMGVLTLFKILCKLFTGPAEMALRPRFGTRYFDLPTMLTQFALIQAIATASWFVDHGPIALFSSTAPVGMVTFVWVFYGGCIYHGWRIWQLMNHMDKEPHSEDEGEPLPFYVWLPKGDRWSRVRVIYEPLTVIVLGISFGLLHIITTTAAMYMVFVGVLLSVSACFYWYQGWLLIRIHKDREAELHMLKKILGGGTKAPQTIRSIPVGPWIPKGASPQEEAVFVAELLYKDKLPTELESMLSPVNRDKQ